MNCSKTAAPCEKYNIKKVTYSRPIIMQVKILAFSTTFVLLTLYLLSFLMLLFLETFVHFFTSA